MKEKGKINFKKEKGEVIEPGGFAIKVNSVEGLIGHLVQGRFVFFFFSQFA